MKLLDLTDKIWSNAEIAIRDHRDDVPDTINEIIQSALHYGECSQIPWKDSIHPHVYSVGTVDDVIVIEIVV